MECGSIIRELMLAIDDSICRKDTISDSEIAKLTKSTVDRLSPDDKVSLFQKSIDFLKLEPGFAEDVLRAFFKRTSTTEKVTDQLAQMFRPDELGPVILRIVENIASLEKDQTAVPKQLISLSIRLLKKASQYYNLQKLVKLIATNSIVTEPKFSMEERHKLCRESIPVQQITVDDQARALTEEIN